jgi:hypothetical protein
VIHFSPYSQQNNQGEKCDAGYRNGVCAVQRRFRFYGKRAGNFLSAEYDAAAKMLEMPFKKSGDGGKRTDAVRDGLR